MLILHDNEMHLIVKIPLTNRDISISLVRIYDIPVPLPENATKNPKIGIFAQYDWAQHTWLFQEGTSRN